MLHSTRLQSLSNGKHSNSLVQSLSLEEKRRVVNTDPGGKNYNLRYHVHFFNPSVNLTSVAAKDIFSPL